MNSKSDKIEAPKFGIFLLEFVLLDECRENEIGDLEEEYQSRFQANDNNAARKWFWIQVIIIVAISLSRYKAVTAIVRTVIATVRVVLERWQSRLEFVLLTRTIVLLRRPQMVHNLPFVAFTFLLMMLILGPSHNDISELLPSRNLLTPSSVEQPKPLDPSFNPSATRPAHVRRRPDRRRSNGRPVTGGLVATDPSGAPTKVRIDAEAYSGEYLVTDSDKGTRKPISDIWRPATRGRYNSVVEP